MTWTIYRDSKLAWLDMLEACRKAERTIDLEQFIFINDTIGQQFIDVCIERAQAGVRVRFLWDAAGSFSFFGSSIVEDLRDKGIELRFFKTLIPLSLWHHRFWFFRNHRRSLVIDSEIAFTGSMSIWEETHDWMETHVRVQGPVVESIEAAFRAMWNRAQQQLYRWPRYEPVDHGDFSYVTNSPVRKMKYLYKKIYDALAGAKKNIYITSPYFCPDRTILKLITQASRRGVNVHLLLPKTSDHPFVDIAAQSFFEGLLKHGVRIFLYEKGMLHSKSMIVDDTWSTIGTLNMDNVSLRYNFEANLVSRDRLFIKELTQHFVEDISKSTELSASEWKQRSSRQKLLEYCIRPFRSLL